MFSRIKEPFLRIFGLIKKEFVAMFMDPGSRKVLFVPIVVQCLIFGYGANFQLSRVPFVYFDASGTEISRSLLFTLRNTPIFETVATCNDFECVREKVDSGGALIGLYFLPDFKTNHRLGIISDARNTASANTAVSYVSSIVSDFNKSRGASPINFSLEERYLFNENDLTRNSILIGMVLALSVIQVLLLSSLTVSREREEGTFDMMLMTPAGSLEILIGKALPPVTVATMQGLIIAIICQFYFDIPLQGNVFAFITILIVFSLSIVGIGMAISTLSSTSMQSLVTAFIMVLPIIMTSGVFTSVDAMPAFFKPLAYLNPLFYGVNALLRIYLEGQSLFSVLHLFVPLILVGAVTMIVAARLFRSKID